MTSRYSGCTLRATTALWRPVTRMAISIGFGRARGAVVHAGVGDVHAGQLGNHGLELEDGLQRALRDLRLVGRVAGEELAALHQRIDDHRAVVAIGAGAQEAGVAGRVLLAGGVEVVDDFALALLARDVEVAGEAILGGNDGEQIVDGCRADFVEHLLAFGGTFR